MSEKVILYTTLDCDVCDTARRGLAAQGVDFEERNVTKDESWFNEALSHANSVPIIIRGTEVEIGWKGLVG